MSSTPLLVIHGISNRSPREFAQTVTDLQAAIGDKHVLFDFFWGDLGGLNAGLVDTLPSLWPRSVRAVPLETRTDARQAASQVISARILTGRPGGSSLFDVRSSPELAQQVDQAVAASHWLKEVTDIGALEAVGDLLREALESGPTNGTTAASPTNVGPAFGGPGDVEVRAERASLIGRLVARVDGLIGKLTAGLGGTLNQLLRGKLAVPIALTLGDIVAYHQNRRQIHERLFARLDARAEGFGTLEQPIDVMAHSLGGLLVLDAMLGAVLERKLHVRKLVTFGSQPAFFHVMTPRAGIPPYVSPHGRVRLPAGSVGAWTNLWHPLDVLAFATAPVFELPDGSAPLDLEVETPGSDIIERKGWLHSVYWENPMLARQWRWT